jgi:hypothetical protein
VTVIEPSSSQVVRHFIIGIGSGFYRPRLKRRKRVLLLPPIFQCQNIMYIASLFLTAIAIVIPYIPVESFQYRYSHLVDFHQVKSKALFRPSVLRTAVQGEEEQKSSLNNDSNKKMTKLVIASRLHLGRASSPPSKEHIQNILSNLGSMALSVEQDNDTLEVVVVIAVDATPKIEGYSYVDNIQNILAEEGCSEFQSYIKILPVSPWGKFVSALNSLVLYAKSACEADLILFVSAEVKASAATIQTLCQHVLVGQSTSEAEPTVVIAAGAALNGHEYAGKGNTVALSGRYENIGKSQKGQQGISSKTFHMCLTVNTFCFVHA